MADTVTEAGNEILTNVLLYADWDGEDGTPPEDITLGTKLEGHPLGWLSHVDKWPGLFVVPMGWPSNTKEARQYKQLFSCAIYVVVAFEENTQPYQEAREMCMKVKRNLVGARAETTHILGLSYLAEEVWMNATPENEFARYLRESGEEYACASMAFSWTAYSDSEDTG